MTAGWDCSKLRIICCKNARISLKLGIMRVRILLSLLCSASLVSAASVETEMASAAQRFLAVLGPEQVSKAVFKLGDSERKNWHFIPRPRLGLSLKEMSPEQRLVAQALLATGLSSQGYSKALTVMSLEAVLAELERGQTGKAVRDPELYFFSIFGNPGEGAAWGWRLEGHHLSLNFTCSGKGTASTPSFYGANPGEVREGPRMGLRVLESEEALGRSLVESLTEDQRKQGILAGEAPKDVLNDPKRVEMTVAEGVLLSSLSAAQQELAAQLIKGYLGTHRAEVAASEWERIRGKEWGKARFCWIGGLEPGVGHYYRIQGENFVMEYDNTQ
ncbi:MAG: DUF3500 domain-containing protein, partial [Verrucomicrobia bacterium]|nr:DUF3500 domain-containing protein [Verrucomicrobiota bacterium]